MVLRLASSGATQIQTYQFDRSIVDRYLAVATVLRMMDGLEKVLSFLILISLLDTRSARSQISPLGLDLGNMLIGLLASQGEMIFLAFQSSIIGLYGGRILSGTVDTFGLGSVFPLMRLRW